MREFFLTGAGLGTIYICGVALYFTGWYLWYVLIHIGRDGFRPLWINEEIAFEMLLSLVWPPVLVVRLLAFLAEKHQYRDRE